VLALLTLVAGRAPAAAPASFTKQVAPLLTRYCTGCHGGVKPRGGLALDTFRDEAAALKDRTVWDRVLQNLRAGDMPPPNKPRPSRAEIDSLATWVQAAFARVDCGKIDPGRPILRRLNRAEYNNTIRDLVGVDFQPADDFPADDVGHGFDNIGDVLSLPPILLEKYLAAAEKIVDTAFRTPELRARILICEPGPGLSQLEAGRKILEHFARRAYRRPVTPEEVDRLFRFVRLAGTQGDGFEHGIRLAVTAVLVSPHFLFRVEVDPPPSRYVTILAHPVTDHELACRLSYFLWSTMPDEELFEKARAGTLHKPDVLEAQVRRMLHDDKVRRWSRTSATSGSAFVTSGPRRPTRPSSQASTMPCARPCSARQSCSSRRSSGRTAASSTSSTPTSPSSTAGWRSTMASPVWRATSSGGCR
jgi:hypothetical protein